MKRKSKWLKHAIAAMIVSALIIGFMLPCTACYWRGFVDGRRVYHNKAIACVAYKGKFNCKIMEGLNL